MPKKIAIIGPESTGKSTLAQGLAAEFKEPFVPEYGRIYLQMHGPAYQYEDLEVIADKMVSFESEQFKNADKLLFCDTDLLMMKVWYQVKFQKVPEKLLKQIEEQPYDFYFICFPDLAWEYDPLRENPEIRHELFEMYVQEVEKKKIPYHIIKGEGRVEQAIAKTKKLDIN